MVSRTVSIPARFNGPLASGNGGYCAGTIAALLGEGPAEVSLRAPVPLQTPLSIVDHRQGIRAMDGERLIAEARPAPDFAPEAPQPIGLDEAREAMTRYRGPLTGAFSECFVCGRARDDSLGVFAGAVPRRRLVACAFTPPSWSAGPDGTVGPEIVWAVLDCPTYFAAYLGVDPAPLALLARQRARLLGAVRAGDEHIVIAWPTHEDGRKRLAASALFSASGELLAASEALLVEPRPTPSPAPAAAT